jgi:3'(2'), 5'-bisphosphate nucleotidase
MELVAKKLEAILCPRGSVGIKAGLLGEDFGDFFFSWGNLGEWDVCAPQIIAEEAGGRVTDCKGNPLSYGTENHRIAQGVLFSNGKCHTHVLEAIMSVNV